jgi:hypothetical protein
MQEAWIWQYVGISPFNIFIILMTYPTTSLQPVFQLEEAAD